MNRIQKWLHDKLGWAFLFPTTESDFNKRIHLCKFCDWRIEKDSQGNWFHLSPSSPQ